MLPRIHILIDRYQIAAGPVAKHPPYTCYTLCVKICTYIYVKATKTCASYTVKLVLSVLNHRYQLVAIDFSISNYCY